MSPKLSSSAGFLVLGALVVFGCRGAEDANSSQKPAPAPSLSAAQRAVEAMEPAPAARVRSVDALVGSPETYRVGRDHVSRRLAAAPHCAGHYTAEPTLRLEVEEAGTLRVEAIAKNDIDMTMAIGRAGGPWSCFDDGAGGRDPGGLLDVEPGLYEIYVGSYAPRRALDYTLRAEKVERVLWQDCAQSEVIPVSAGTNTRLSGAIQDDLVSCSWLLGLPQCLWHLTQTPIACIDVSAEVDLVVSTEDANFDTVLALQQLVPGPALGDLRLLNDDVNQRTLSEVRSLTAPGRYAIFVGSYRHRNDGTYHVRVQASAPQKP